MAADTWQSILAHQAVDNDRRLVRKLRSGESVYRQDRVLMVLLPEGRSTLITSHLNGGYREDLRAVFNSTSLEGAHDVIKIEEYSAYLKAIAERVGLNPETCSGLSTAVHMDNAAIVTSAFRSTEVTAIVTAGVEGNGGRAGDPAFYVETRGVEPLGGTIVTMLLINGDLPEHAMARAIMTATEAKTCALQQLMARSRYSTGIATGSGTDQIAVIGDRTSSNRLTDAGKHSKLGELIGKSVIAATLEALNKHGGLNPESQRDALVRLGRFNMTESDIWKASTDFPGPCIEQDFYRSLKGLAKRPDIVAATGSILHLKDEMDWGLVPDDVGRRIGGAMVRDLPRVLEPAENGNGELMVDMTADPVTNLVNGLAQMAKYGW